LADRVGPQQKSFTFRAPHDGEYWFLIRTVDRQGRMKPENIRTPELRVIVDSMPPRLELRAERSPSGEILAHWLAVDPLLKADTLKIEYQIAGENGWRVVQFQSPPDDASRSTAVGDVAWRPAAPGTVIVRAEIRDRAGNTAITQATVGGGLPASEGPTLGTPAGNPESTPPSPAGPQTSERHDLTAGRKSPRRFAAGNNAGSPTADSSGGTSWPADQVASQPLQNSGFRARPGDDKAGVGRLIPTGQSVYSQSIPPAATRPVESGINPPVTERVVAPPAQANIFTQGLPPGERPYMVNSRKFALEYEVESVGPAGIAKVEIWGTIDGGKKWDNYDIIEPNGEGPVQVRVEGEGLYGFRITVQDRNGFGGRPPRSGDLPELWVGVDLTKPVAKLTSIDLGAGEHSGELIIRWEASDAMLAARPITLSFSERPEGPWSTIAAGLENSGVFNWRFENRVPDRIYLRLEVRDEAGNVGEFQAPDPISLAPNRPQGRLRTVHPMEDEAARVQVYHFYQ
jgi:hypothetical protein